MTIIEIRPHRWGWKAFEALGVELVFPEKAQAIDFAQNRACAGESCKSIWSNSFLPRQQSVCFFEPQK